MHTYVLRVGVIMAGARLLHSAKWQDNGQWAQTETHDLYEYEE